LSNIEQGGGRLSQGLGAINNAILFNNTEYLAFLEDSHFVNNAKKSRAILDWESSFVFHCSELNHNSGFDNFC
jgi:hypothetical protein